MRFQKTQVSRDFHTGLKQHKIARHQLPRLDEMNLRLADDTGGHAYHGAKGCRTFLSPPLLIRTQDGVEYNNEKNEGAILPLARHTRNSASRDEHINQRAKKLVKENLEYRLAAWLGNAVVPICLNTCRYFTL